MSEDKRFYVYVHRYSSGPKQGEIFYVGKGSGDRYKSRNGRNPYWERIVSKYGYTNEIILRFESEKCAFSFERNLIKFYGRDALSNLTDGGEGASGYEWKDDVRILFEKHVYCSNGMKFRSLASAQDWLRENGFPSASFTRISSCANGSSLSAYGYSWSFYKTPLPPENPHKVSSREQKKRVYCSNGMDFDCLSDAVTWIKSIGHPSADKTNISGCANSKHKSAYGFSWSYNSCPDEPTSPHTLSGMAKRRPVICGDGVIFDDAKHAAEWLKKNGYPKADRSNICACARGERRIAYGKTWSYVGG